VDLYGERQEAQPEALCSARSAGTPEKVLRLGPGSVPSQARCGAAQRELRAPATENGRLRGAAFRPTPRAWTITQGDPMKSNLVFSVLACCLVVSARPAASQQPAAAPPAATPPATAAPPAEAPAAQRTTSEAQVAPKRWDVERVRCSDLLGAADDDRAAAGMFYYGYLAAKAGIRVIDTSQIEGNLKKVMERCEAAPNITVPQAFREALGRRR
jgi:HdeA/HdeB family